MGRCFGCFWTEEDNNGNEVNHSDIFSTDGLSNKCSPEIAVQNTSNNIKTQEKTEEGKGNAQC